MRSLRQTTPVPAWPSLRDTRGRLLGLPFAVMALAPGSVFGWRACFAALMIASLANFLVFVPMTVLAMNGGRPVGQDTPIPALTARAYAALLLLWTMSVWLGAAAAPHLR